MGNRSDNFDRANSNTALGTPSDGGTDWVAVSGTWGIDTNRGYNVSGGGSEIAYLESSAANVETQVTAVVLGSEASIVHRLADVNNYIMLIYGDSVGGQFLIYKNVGGVLTELATAAATFAANDVIKFRSNGNTHTGYLNDVQKITVDDAAGSTNTKHGLRVNGTSAPRFEDFSITDLDAVVASRGGGTTRPTELTWTDVIT